MKNRVLKQVVAFFAFAAILSSFASCNKGYGCPNNFKVEKVVVKTAEVAAKVAVKTISE